MDTPPRTVVIIEDEPDQRELLEASLARSGRYHVVGHAEDADLGVARAQSEQPDVILLDLRLRDSAGQTSIPHLLVVTPQAMVVAISGFDDPNAHQQALDAGAFAFVAKTPRLYEDDRLATVLDQLSRRFQAMLQGEEVVAPITIDPDLELELTTLPMPATPDDPQDLRTR